VTRAEIEHELAGLVPVVIHYRDHWGEADSEESSPTDVPPCLRLAIGFLIDPQDPSKGIVRDVTIAPPDLAGKGERASVIPGGFRAVTYLRPLKAVPYTVTIEAGEAINLGAAKRQTKGPKQ
jgi:hypothetical protein